MAASPYTAKELTAFSAIRLSITIVSVLFANNLLSEVSLLSKTNSSLNIFSLFFGVSTFLLLRAKSKTKFRIGDLAKVFLTVLAYAVLFHILAILYGAPLVEQGEETFCWSFLMAVLIAIPPCSLLSPDLGVSQRIFLSRWEDVTLEAYLQHGIAVTVLGAWLGAFVIPLDWDRPWQVSTSPFTGNCSHVWPVPCAVGALVGHVIGIVTSTVTYHFNAKRMRDKLKPV